jgi:hypothetical protein
MSYCKGLTKQYKKIAKHQWNNGLNRRVAPKDLVDYTVFRTETALKHIRKGAKVYYPDTGKM